MSSDSTATVKGAPSLGFTLFETVALGGASSPHPLINAQMEIQITAASLCIILEGCLSLFQLDRHRARGLLQWTLDGVTLGRADGERSRLVSVGYGEVESG